MASNMRGCVLSYIVTEEVRKCRGEWIRTGTALLTNSDCDQVVCGPLSITTQT